MAKLLQRMQSPELINELDKQLNSVHSELKHMEHAFKKGDDLRVSNALLAAGRMSDALSRQAFVKELASWTNTLETMKPADLKNFTANFQYVLEREFEKNRLDAKLCSIQNAAEKGFVPRESIAQSLRDLANEIEGGGYPILLARTPTQDELLGAARRTAEA